MALAEYLGLSKLSDEDWKGSPAIAARESQAPLWAVATGAGTAPLAEATPDLRPAGEAGPATPRAVSSEHSNRFSVRARPAARKPRECRL
jgi:hypothetical protein